MRDRMRFATTLRLLHDTSEAQLILILRDIETLLRTELKVWPDTVQVSLAAISPSSLDIEILCWFRTAAMEEFLVQRQKALLGIVRVIREAGTGFAVPMQTILVARDPTQNRHLPASAEPDDEPS